MKMRLSAGPWSNLTDIVTQRKFARTDRRGSKRVAIFSQGEKPQRKPVLLIP